MLQTDESPTDLFFKFTNAWDCHPGVPGFYLVFVCLNCHPRTIMIHDAFSHDWMWNLFREVLAANVQCRLCNICVCVMNSMILSRSARLLADWLVGCYCYTSLNAHKPNTFCIVKSSNLRGKRLLWWQGERCWFLVMFCFVDALSINRSMSNIYS